MRISKLADYGAIVMVYLARQAHRLCNARDIALHTHLNVPTVSKILKRLAQAGLLTSVRGVAGGYRLILSPADVSIGQIIHALEDQHGVTECSLQPNECSLQGVCTLQENWKLINQVIASALHSVSLESLAKPTVPLQDLERVRQLVSGVSRG